MKIAIKNDSAIKIYNGDINYEALILFIKKEFQLSPSKYSLTYVDEDGDNITLASNEDMTSAYELNSNKSLLKVKLSLVESAGEDEHVEFEVINHTPVVEPEIKQEVKAQEKTEKQEINEHKRHKWGFWGRNRSHHKSSSESSHEGHHGHGRRFRMWHHMMNTLIAEKVDQRMKSLIHCMKAQLEGGNVIKTFSVANPVIHQNTECKSCLSTPIVGIRYKCLECPNFNLCQNCEPAVQHGHNLLKMKYIAQDKNGCQFPFKMLKKFWKHGGHRSHSSSSEKWGKEQKATRKLAKIFGGQAQQYQEFVKLNPSLNKFELINKFASENGQEEQLISFRCEKIAKRLDKKPQEFRQIVKNNMNLRPWELVHKIAGNGDETRTLSGKCERYLKKCEKFDKKCQKEERKCKKSSQKKDKSHGKWRHHHQKPLCEEKLSGCNQRREKGKILETLIGLFGGNNVKEYFELIEQHFSMGQEAIINKWLETHCSQLSA